MTLDIEGTLSAHILHASMNICRCGDWRPVPEVDLLANQHRAHVAAVLREQIEGTLAAAARLAFDDINELLVSHDMWIDDVGRPLDYLPEREARIADFMGGVDHILTAHLSDIERAGGAG